MVTWLRYQGNQILLLILEGKAHNYLQQLFNYITFLKLTKRLLAFKQV